MRTNEDLSVPSPKSGAALARMALVLSLSALGGCQRSFFDAAQQQCVERSLTRAPRELVVEAAAQFRRTCGAGDASSCSALGIVEERGLLAPARPDEALRLFEVACRGGDDRGCANLARTLLGRSSDPGSRRRAIRLLERACAAADPAACGALGAELVGGPGAPGTRQRGRQLLQSSCRRGEGSACLHLGDDLALDAVPAASALWMKACVLGEGEACGRTARTSRIALALERLTPP